MPSLRVTSNGVAARTAGAVRDRARNLLPATRVVGEFITRLASRRAPVRRGSAKLKNSLNYATPAHNEVVLQTPLAYGPIQNRGGTIVPVSAKALAIPLNETARKMSEFLGAGLSLRSLDLQVIKTKRGDTFLALDRSKINRSGKVRPGQTFRVRKTFASPTAGHPLTKVKKGQRRRRGKLRRSQSTGRRAALPQRDDLEFLFILKARVTLRPNPAPRGYAPRVDEPPVRDFMNRTVAGYVLRGEIAS